MSKIIFSPLIASVTGKYGNVVVRRQHGGFVTAHRPDPDTRKPPTEKQRVQRENFRQAQAYAAGVLADPLQREIYRRLAVQRKRASNNILIQDWNTPPEIELIDLSLYHGQSGERIRVLATDDIAVASVTVTIRDAGGAILESGPATEIHGVWVYTTTTTLPVGTKATIEALAKDRPANETILRVTYPK